MCVRNARGLYTRPVRIDLVNHTSGCVLMCVDNSAGVHPARRDRRRESIEGLRENGGGIVLNL